MSIDSIQNKVESISFGLEDREGAVDLPVQVAISPQDGSVNLSPERTGINPPPIAERVERSVPRSETLVQPPPFSINLPKAPPKDPLVQINDLLDSSTALTPDQVKQIHRDLLDSEGAFKRFLELKGNDDKSRNRQFEKFLRIIHPDLINENRGWIGKIAEFAFSLARFEWIQLNETDIGSDLLQEIKGLEKQLRRNAISDDIERFKTSHPDKSSTWLKRRMSGSTTIHDSSTVQATATKNWMAADRHIQRKAAESSRTFSFGFVQILHKKLTADEVDNPGELRTDVARSSTALLIYPVGPSVLDEFSDSYGRWLDQQIKLCDAGTKSVIVTAAQAYQRLVSIHPFENGNGRISRLMMDYVLERFGLPPAVLGQEVLDAVFALNIKSPSAQEAFVRKVVEGVKVSSAAIEGKAL